MMRLLCAIVVAESCLLSSEKNERNTVLRVCDCGVVDFLAYVGALNFSNKMPSIDTDIFTP